MYQKLYLFSGGFQETWWDLVGLTLFRFSSVCKEKWTLSDGKEQANGGPVGSLSQLNVPPLEILDTIEFVHTPLFKDRMFLQQKYVVEGLSLAQISKQICSSKSTIRKHLECFGISVREPYKPHGRLSQLRYGLRLQKSKIVVVYQTEQKVINAIVELKEQGMGLRQIARTLTKLGISTKCRGKGWHPEMVRRILSNVQSLS